MLRTMNCWLGAPLVLSVLIATSICSAQEFRATLTGRMTDASGAAIPGASVVAKNVATNAVGSAKTDSQGNYTIPFLTPGDYVLTAEAKGFKKYNREGLALQVSQVASINIQMEVGQMTESVSVSGEVPLVETSTADRGVVVDLQRVKELPLNARNPYMLGTMMSGVTFRGAAIWQRPFDNGAIAQWSMNGGRESNNEFMLDGAPNNAQAGGNNVAYVPIVDAVQEFRVQTNSYDAEFGKTAGGVMNVVLKSGSNQHHITAWEFLRRTPLDANTFQNNAIGAPRAEHYLDQYGWQFDGPIQIPKIYNGKNKSFYLGSFENYREGTPTPLRLSYPELDMRRGDFSKLVDPSGRPITIYNPFTGRADASAPSGWRRDPFPGNIIPSNLIDPVAANISKYFPQPNAKTPGVAYSQQNVLFPNYFAQDKFYNLILKFDQNIGDRHRLFFRHASNDRTEDRNANGIFSGPGQDGQQPFQRINDAYVIDYVGTLKPTLVLNIRLSNNRFIEKGLGRGNDGFDISSLGFPASQVNQLPSPRFFGLYQFDGYTSVGRYQSINITNNYNIATTVTKIWNNHTIKAGFDLRRIHYILQNTGNIWRFQGTRGFTQGTFNQGNQLEGDGYASFLLGIPSSGEANYPLFPFYRQWYLSPYVQDDWKVTRKLTLNLGLRVDYNLPPDEKYNRINGNLDTSSASPIASQINRTQFPQFANLRGGMTFAGINGQPTKVANINKTNFQPRIGVAYQLNEKTVLRGGYGLYYMNPNNDYLISNGFSSNTPLISSLDDGRTPVSRSILQNPFPTGVIPPSGSSQGLSTFAGRDFSWFDPTFKTPKVHQFSIGFQRQVAKTMSIDVSYAGSRTVNAQDSRAFNIPTADFRKTCNPLEGGSPAYCNELQPNPFQGISAFQGTTFFTAATLSRFQLNRPVPQFSGNLTQRGRNDGSLSYNSLQVNYNWRMRGGISLLGNYTFAKNVERANWNDPYRNVLQSGLYFNDRPHYFKLTGIYELPFGKGKKFLPSVSGLADKIVSGWQWTTFYTFSSGEPADLPGNVRILRDPKVSTNWNSHQPRGWSNCVLRMFDDGSIAPQQYSLDAGCGTDQSKYSWLILPNYAPRELPYRSGNIRMMPTITMDASLNKTTQITERLKVQFRAEAFNLLNHYAIPLQRFNTDPFSANFGTLFLGQVSTTNSGFPRQIQLGVKILF